MTTQAPGDEGGGSQPGIELFLSSGKAVDAADKFRNACDSCANAIERLGAGVDKLDASFQSLGQRATTAIAPVTATAEALKSTTTAATTAGDALKKGGESIVAASRSVNDFNTVGRATASTLRLVEVATGATFVQVRGFSDAFATLSNVIRANPFVAAATAAAALGSAIYLFGSDTEQASKKARDHVEELKKLEDQQKHMAAAFASAVRKSAFDDASARESTLREAREQLRKLGEEVEGAGERFPIKRLLDPNLLSLAGPDSQLAKLKGLLDELPEAFKHAREGRDQWAERSRALDSESKLTDAGLFGDKDLSNSPFFRAADLMRERFVTAQKAAELVQEAVAGIVKRSNEAGISMQGFIDTSKLLQQAQAEAERKRAASVGDVVKQLERERDLLQEQGAARQALARQQQVEVDLSKVKGGVTEEERTRIYALLAANRDLLLAEERRKNELRTERAETRAAIADWKKEQQELARAAEGFGATVGDALGRIIVDGQRARDVMAQLANEISRQIIQQSTAKLFGMAAVSLFGGPPVAAAGGSPSAIGAPAGFYSPSAIGAPAGGGYPNLLGGVIPAMGGQVVDEFAFMRRGGRTYSIAEGGKSTPEVILPLERDQYGRLGVGSSGGGGGTVINMSFPAVRTAQDARATRATVGQRVRQLLAADRRGRRGLRPQGV